MYFEMSMRPSRNVIGSIKDNPDRFAFFDENRRAWRATCQFHGSFIKIPKKICVRVSRTAETNPIVETITVITTMFYVAIKRGINGSITRHAADIDTRMDMITSLFTPWTRYFTTAKRSNRPYGSRHHQGEQEAQ